MKTRKARCKRPNPRVEYLLRRLNETEDQAIAAFRALDDLMCTIERVREFLLSESAS